MIDESSTNISWQTEMTARANQRFGSDATAAVGASARPGLAGEVSALTGTALFPGLRADRSHGVIGLR